MKRNLKMKNQKNKNKNLEFSNHNRSDFVLKK